MITSVTGTDAWTFGVLGPLVLAHDGRDVALTGGRPRTLLALLLAHPGQPLSAERLADELWGEHPPASAPSALHVHLSKVRSVIGDLLLKQGNGYLLDPGRVELDADRLSMLATGARSDPSRAGELVAEALALWRGEPLPDLTTSETLNRWRSELEERHLQAVMLHADIALESGAGAALIPELARLVEEHPYQEGLWERLMLALYRHGRRSEALDAYQRARRILTVDLGLEPGEELRRLQARMLEGDLPLPPTPTAAPPPPVPAAPNPTPAGAPTVAIPRPTTRLIGRAQELEDLLRLSTHPRCRLITLVGEGGVGKTRLAIEHALRWAEAFSDGAVFVPLTEITASDQAGGLLAATLARRTGAPDLTERGVAAFLAERQTLLVLDNFEHVLGASTFVSELLAEAPGLKVIATSRYPLRLRGEHLIDVRGLPVSAIGDPAGGPAVDLFVEGATSVDAQFEATPAVRRSVAAICRALDGLPLAIELAAASARLRDVSQIEAQLTEPLKVGSHALVDLPDRHQTLTATIRWSYDLLSPAAQRTLRAAACFHGSFTSAALSAVAGAEAEAGAAADSTLEELLDASVIRRSDIPGRYRLLELVWAFAREVAATHPTERSGFQAAHRAHYVETYAWAATPHNHSTPGEIARELAPDRLNLRSAADNAISAGDAESSLALLYVLRSLWRVEVANLDAAELIDAALAHCTFEPTAEMRLLRVAVANTLYSWELNDRWLRRFRDRAAAVGTHTNVADATGMLLVAALTRRDVAEVLAQRDALRALPEPTEPFVRADRAFYLSQAAYVEGDFAGAAELAEQMYVDGDDGPLAHNHALCAMWQLITRSARDGRIPRSALLAQLQTAQDVGIVDLQVVALWNAARYAAAVDPELALEWLAHADQVANEYGFTDWPSDALRVETVALLSGDGGVALTREPSGRTLRETLDAALFWLEQRDPDESVRRTLAPATRVDTPVTAIVRLDGTPLSVERTP